MAHKQHHLEAAHDQAHKTRARDLGSSETGHARREALAQLLDDAQRLSQEHRLPEGYRFDRDELYDERESRWPKRR